MRVAAYLVWCLVGASFLRADDSPSPYWPLAIGTFWLYEGDVSWVEKNPATDLNQVYNKHLTWRSEVTDVVTINGVLVAKLHGFPDDLIWYNSKTEPSDRLLLQIGPDYYVLISGAAEVFQKLKDNPADWRSCYQALDRAELYLPTPLVPEKRFGGSPGNLIEGRFCQVVDGPAPFDLKSIQGSPPLKTPLAFSVSSRENTDNSQWNFVPGLGITFDSYSHHGTTMEVSVHLIQFGQLSPPASTVVAQPTNPK